MKKYSTPNGIRIGHTGLKVEYLAYEDDIVFYVENLDLAIKQIETLKETEENDGLQISNEIKEYIIIAKFRPLMSMK